jgi:hypothetical protein
MGSSAAADAAASSQRRKLLLLLHRSYQLSRGKMGVTVWQLYTALCGILSWFWRVCTQVAETMQQAGMLSGLRTGGIRRGRQRGWAKREVAGICSAEGAVDFMQ